MTIRENIAATYERIEAARAAYGRTDPVHLELAVKTRSPAQCREAAQCLHDLGQKILLGHNRVQEARATHAAIREVEGARIHLIGPLQSNKINQALSCVDAVETLDSPVLVEKIDARLERRLPVFIEVNVSGENTKHGVTPKEVPALVETVVSAQFLELSGFMTVGLNSPVESDVRAAYAALRAIRDRAESATGLAGLALSMGMSKDLEWAVAEGATIVRIGTCVFGPRAPRPSTHSHAFQAPGGVFHELR